MTNDLAVFIEKLDYGRSICRHLEEGEPFIREAIGIRRTQKSLIDREGLLRLRFGIAEEKSLDALISELLQ